VPAPRRISLPEGRPPWAVAVAGAALLVLLLSGVLVGVLTLGSDDEASQPDTSTRVVATVPSVVGMTRARAGAVLARAGLENAVEPRASRKPKGRVLVQKPRAGSRVERGVAILLVVSSGRKAAPRPRPGTPASTQGETTTLPERPTDTVIVEPEPPLSQVPGVLEVGFVDAARFVESRGFVADSYVVASTRPRGLVLRQRPAPGTMLAKGRKVRLYISAGVGVRPPARLDDYTGLPEDEARDQLQRAGFTVRTVDRAAPSRRRIGFVLDQNPAGGQSKPVLTQVVLYVGR
jgi:eukaryotic-like serine/threonine-protein kinase